jgi:hypothetical protein
MLGYWPYATHKNIFYIFLCQKHKHYIQSQLKLKKPHISQILKALINQLLNPKKYIETCSYIFPGNTT